MIQILLIAIGGAAGAALRYLTGLAAVHIFSASRILTGTVIVNILGCFTAGYLTARLLASDLPGGNAESLLLIGMLGSYTTFSTFAFESIQIYRHSLQKAALYMAVQGFGGIGSAAAGYAVAAYVA